MRPNPSRLVMLDPCELRETKENWHVYRRPTEDDPSWIELRASIAKNGVTAALEVSSDLYIRRFVADTFKEEL